MKILVIGAAGFIGSHTCRRLLADGHTVIAHRMPGSFAPRLKGLGIDARPEYMTALQEGMDAVVYAAGPARSVERMTGSDLALAMGAFPTLCQSAVEAPKKPRIILLTSHAVYGSVSAKQYGHIPVIEEDTPLAPRSLYGALQASREIVGLAFWRSRGLPITILRLGTVYGSQMRPDALVQVFLDAALNGGIIKLEGGGKQFRPFVHVDDLTDLIVKVIAADATVSGEAYNVASGSMDVRTLARFVNDAARALGKEGAQFVDAPARAFEEGDVTLSNHKAQSAPLWWIPKVIFQDWVFEGARALLEERA